MGRNPKDTTTNVLHNEQAMAILKDAMERLKDLGLHCGFGPDILFPESDMSAVLRVSTSEQAFDECIAGGLLASQYAGRPDGRKEFDEVLAELRANWAISNAMNGPRSAPNLDQANDMSFTTQELYEVNDALNEVVTRMCEQGQTDIEIREHSLRHLWSASKKVTVMLLGDADTPGIKNHEPIVLQAIENPKSLKS